MALTDFTLSNARPFYSSMGNPLGVKELRKQIRMSMNQGLVEKSWKFKFYIWKFVYCVLQVPQSIT